MGWAKTIVVFLRALLRDRAELAGENLALRQQLAVLQQKSKRPRLRNRDRIFWALLSRSWSNWRSVLVIVPARYGRSLAAAGLQKTTPCESSAVVSPKRQGGVVAA